MNLDFLKNIQEACRRSPKKHIEKTENINNEDIDEVEIELANKLDAVISYTVDRFEGNIAVLENRQTGKMEEIDKNKLPEDTKEGDILKCINGKFFVDEELRTEVENRIKKKMDGLWN